MWEELREHHRWRNAYLRQLMACQQSIAACCRRLRPSGTKKKSPESDVLRKEVERWIHGKGELSTEEAEWFRPFRQSFLDHEGAAKETAKEMVKIVTALPAWPWVESMKGIGALGFAQIIAEAGDLCAYSRPAKLHRRFGVGFVWIGGERFTQTRRKGSIGLEMRRSEPRRKLLHSVGDSAMRAKGPYRDMYLAFKVEIIAKKEAAGVRVVPAAKVKGLEKKGDPADSDGHVHKMALRKMENRLLTDLWVAWRERCFCGVSSGEVASEIGDSAPALVAASMGNAIG